MVNSQTESHPWWKPIAAFAGHTIVATVIFIIIAVPAVGLALSLKWLESLGIPAFPLKVLDYLADGLCVLDAAVFFGYIVRTSMAIFKEFEE